MGIMNIEGVKLTPLKIIEGHLGAVMHAVKKNDMPIYFAPKVDLLYISWKGFKCPGNTRNAV